MRTIDSERARQRVKERLAGLATMNAESEPARVQLRDYLDRTGMKSDDFGRRINYSGVTVRAFLAARYHNIGASDANIRRAVQEFIAAHPITPPQQVQGELYDTANIRTVMETFEKLLVKPVAYVIYAPPGSQKSYGLENAVAKLNQQEMSKNGHGRRAYYVSPWKGIRPRQLLHEIAVACGVPAGHDIARIYRALAFEFQARRVLLVIDEAQSLGLDCLEIVRRLLDRPPFFSLLLAGSHDIIQTFDRFSATLEQWNSRIIAKVKLPGLLREEAHGIVRREIGELLAPMPKEKSGALIEKLVDQAVTKDAFEKGRTYINIRTLTNALDQIKAAAEQKSKEGNGGETHEQSL